jgi:FSR family fosmidomycin resistance protein-like MFS transporter
VLLAIELLDELVGGTRAAAWPLIRRDLHLSYAQVGLLLAVPGLLGSALDPIVGALGDTSRRRAVLVGGGVVFAVSAAASAGALGFWTLLVALALGNPASGAFVSLSQATLMDSAPDERERNMARWTLTGSFGYVGGPVLLTAALWVGVGWRGALAVLAVGTLPLLFALPQLPRTVDDLHERLWSSLAAALRALRSRDVQRWLLLLEALDLLGDVLHGFLALYFVDVVHVTPAEAAVGVAVWTAASLAGDWLLLHVLRRFSGFAYLRTTAVGALAVYPAFLLVPGLAPKFVLVAILGLLNSGWYALPQAALYGALPGRSGAAVAVGGFGGLLGAAVPLVLGVTAGAVGLGATMWTLLIAPVALLVLVPRR